MCTPDQVVSSNVSNDLWRHLPSRQLQGQHQLMPSDYLPPDGFCFIIHTPEPFTSPRKRKIVYAHTIPFYTTGPTTCKVRIEFRFHNTGVENLQLFLCVSRGVVNEGLDGTVYLNAVVEMVHPNPPQNSLKWQCNTCKNTCDLYQELKVPIPLEEKSARRSCEVALRELRDRGFLVPGSPLNLKWNVRETKNE